MTTTKTNRTRYPEGFGFRKGTQGNVACPHRDVTCCAACANAYPEIVDVLGQHFWVSDSAERAEMRAEVEAMNHKRGQQ